MISDFSLGFLKSSLATSNETALYIRPIKIDYSIIPYANFYSK